MAPQAPPFIGLTGGIASGKSEALAAFERHGAATMSTDRASHELIDTDEVRRKLVERWGAEVAPDGSVDRERVAQIVFEDPAELRWLETILHPLVAQRVADWRASLPADARAAVVETPLLFEAGLAGIYDATVSVTSPEGEIQSRLAERGMPGDAGRSGRQLSSEEKAERADYVIHNDGTLADLDAAVAEVLDRLTEGEST